MLGSERARRSMLGGMDEHFSSVWSRAALVACVALGLAGAVALLFAWVSSGLGTDDGETTLYLLLGAAGLGSAVGVAFLLAAGERRKAGGILVAVGAVMFAPALVTVDAALFMTPGVVVIVVGLWGLVVKKQSSADQNR